MTIPAGLLLMANVLDVATCRNLHYVESQHGHDSRPMAAAEIVHNDWIRETDTFGFYRVRSRTLTNEGNPIWYRVVANGEETECECAESHLRPYAKKIRDLAKGENPKDFPKPIICCHILACVMYHAMKITFRSE